MLVLLLDALQQAWRASISKWFRFPMTRVAIVTIGLRGTAARSVTGRRPRNGYELISAAAIFSRRR